MDPRCCSWEHRERQKNKVQNHKSCVQSTIIHKSMNYPDLAKHTCRRQKERDKTSNKTALVQRCKEQRGSLSLSRSFTAALQYADRRRRCICNDPSEEMTDCCSASESFSISSVAGKFLKAKCGADILALYASVPW